MTTPLEVSTRLLNLSARISDGWFDNPTRSQLAVIGNTIDDLKRFLATLRTQLYLRQVPLDAEDKVAIDSDPRNAVGQTARNAYGGPTGDTSRTPGSVDG
jgi:hypothetical protein